MTRDDFEVAVIDLASRGVRLTTANVAAFVRLSPGKVEAWLDELAFAGRLEVELDEAEGLCFYRVRGLTPTPPGALAIAPIRYDATPTAPARRHKTPLLAALLGLALPGVGLLYAAPLSAAVFATVATLVSVKMLGALPLVGWLLKSVALGICAIVSALLGSKYARVYNLHGRRAHISFDGLPEAALGSSLTRSLKNALS
jgi:hypothetical protein